MSLEAQLERARAEAKAKRYVTAEVLLRDLLKQDPDNIGALDLLGFVAYFRGKPEQGEEVCRRVLQLSPDHAYAHKGLGLNIAKRGGDMDEAIASIQRAIELEPEWFDPRWDLLVTLVDAKRFELARAELERARQALPKHSTQWDAMEQEIHGRATAAESAVPLNRPPDSPEK
jgi:tetratricopeptide (TPR) repeat protein